MGLKFTTPERTILDLLRKESIIDPQYIYDSLAWYYGKYGDFKQIEKLIANAGLLNVFNKYKPGAMTTCIEG